MRLGRFDERRCYPPKRRAHSALGVCVAAHHCAATLPLSEVGATNFSAILKIADVAFHEPNRLGRRSKRNDFCSPVFAKSKGLLRSHHQQ